MLTPPLTSCPETGQTRRTKHEIRNEFQVPMLQCAKTATPQGARPAESRFPGFTVRHLQAGAANE